MNDILTGILDTVRQVDPVLRVLIAGLGMLLETSVLVGLVVPGDTIVLISATGISDWVQYAGLLVSVIIGALIGESIGFALGRFFGPRIQGSKLGRRLGDRNWIRAENYLARRGGIAVFISRFLPVFHALIPLTVGMSTMRYRTFLAWTAPACLLWSTAYVSVGWLAAGSYRQLSGQLHFAGYLFVGIIVVFLLGVMLVKKTVSKSQAQHMRHPDDPLATIADDGATRP